MSIVGLAAVILAVTVDDLPTTGTMSPGESRDAIATRMLAALSSHRVGEAYGFVNAAQLDEVPAHRSILARWRAAGHPLGNHTWSHVDLDRVGEHAFLDDVEADERALRAFGASTRVLRYPFLHDGRDPGVRTGVRAALGARGYRIAEVTVYFEDWAWNEAYVRCTTRGDTHTAALVRERFVDFAAARLGWAEDASSRIVARSIRHVLLIHVSELTSVALDEVLTRYEWLGARYGTLADAMTDPVYARAPLEGSIDEATFLERVAGATALPAKPERPRVWLERTCR